MYRLSDSRMGKYGFLEFIDRITVLDGDTGNDDDLLSLIHISEPTRRS